MNTNTKVNPQTERRDSDNPTQIYLLKDCLQVEATWHFLDKESVDHQLIVFADVTVVNVVHVKKGIWFMWTNSLKHFLKLDMVNSSTRPCEIKVIFENYKMRSDLTFMTFYVNTYATLYLTWKLYWWLCEIMTKKDKCGVTTLNYDYEW